MSSVFFIYALFKMPTTLLKHAFMIQTVNTTAVFRNLKSVNWIEDRELAIILFLHLTLGSVHYFVRFLQFEQLSYLF